MALTITSSAVTQARALANLGQVSEAWRVLGVAGDIYALGAADITSGNPSFTRTLVENTWENTVGRLTFNQQFNNVAQSHLNNYLTLVENTIPINGRYRLPNTLEIENSYINALESNGVSRNAAIDLLLNQVTDGYIDIPDWPSFLNLFNGNLFNDLRDIEAERIISNSQNYSQLSSWQAFVKITQITWESGEELTGDILLQFQDDIVSGANQLRQWIRDGNLDWTEEGVFSARGLFGSQGPIFGEGGLAEGFGNLLSLFSSAAQDIGQWLLDNVLPGLITARTEGSPLIFDLDGDGIEVSALGSPDSVFWDIDGDGFLELAAWVSPDDGLLVWDRNTDGRIDSQDELFGDLDTDGFDILAALDSNGDGSIDASDSSFAELQIWQDRNSDGLSSASELATLEALGITSISLAVTASSQFIEGNRVSSTSTFTMNGQNRIVADVWFQYDNVQTISAPSSVPLPTAIAALPNLRGYGILADLRIAMASDTVLAGQVGALSAASLTALLDPAFDLDDKFRAMMWRWAGVDDVSANSRGGYIDGRDLAFLEVLSDLPFDQRGSPNPYVEAATTLRNSFEAAQNAMLFRFFAQTHPDSFITGIQFYQQLVDEVRGTLAIDFAKLDAIVDGWNASGQALSDGWSTLVRIIDGAIGLDDLSSAQTAQLDQLIRSSDPSGALNLSAVTATIFPPRGLGLNGTEGADILIGGIGDDDLDTGGGNDELFGRGGNDRMLGGDGDDQLSGEGGDDTLFGGAGNDRYLYSSGLDSIRESSGTDSVQFGPGIAQANVRIAVSPTNESDAHVFVNGVLSIIIEDMFTSFGRVESFRFADGSSFDTTALIVPQNGTAGNDILTGADAGIFPDNYLYGLAGDDRLIGGLGDDRLFGGAGNDSYVVTSGRDRIYDDGGTADRIEFGAAYARSAMQLTRNGDDLTIAFHGTVAATILDQFDSASEAIEQLVFANGETVDLLAQRYTLAGTDGRESLYGVNTGGGGDILFGLGGDDTIYAYAGDDEIDGGTGNDALYGGLGNDRYILSGGVDLIRDDGGTDVIDLSQIERSRVSLTREGTDLLLAIDGITRLRIDDQFRANSDIETVQAADGAIDLLSIVYTITGTNASETIYGIASGGSPDDILLGRGGNDVLVGDVGNDILDGGDGNDELNGGAGNDRYIVGNGQNLIRDRGLATDQDILVLPGSTNPGSVSIVRTLNGNLLISWADGNVGIFDFFETAGAIETLIFGDGSQLALPAFAAPTLGTRADDSIAGNRGTLGTRNDTLIGDDGDDRLLGYDGNDLLDGGAGNDELYGEGGADIYRPGMGNNFVSDNGLTTDAADRLILPEGVSFDGVTVTRQTDGDLVFAWAGGSVRIDRVFDPRFTVERIETATGQVRNITDFTFSTTGTLGDDSFSGNQEATGSRNDRLLGLAGNDDLRGLDGADVLIGGAGDDYLAGGAGADTYVVEGHDVVDESGVSGDGPDVIQLPDGVTVGGATFVRLSDGDIRISWSNGSVRIDDAYDLTSAVEQLRFADGTLWSITDRAAETVGSAAAETIGGNTRALGSRNDVIRGLGGDDGLLGYDGADLLDGGLGNDELYGAAGADTYVVGYGWDYVRDVGVTGDGADILRIGRSDVTLAGITFERLSNNTSRLSWNSGRDGVIIDGTLTGTTAIETLELADGTRIDLATRSYTSVTLPTNLSLFGDANANTLTGGAGNDFLRGNAGNDILESGAGNDGLEGGTGLDIYRLQNGHHRVFDNGLVADGADRILLPSGVTAAALSFIRFNNGDLLVSWADGSVRIDRAFDADDAIELLEFADGTTLSLASVAFFTSGTGGDDGIDGNREELGSRDDDIRGLEGNDALYGYDGDDQLEGGSGDDRLNGNVGNDSYVVEGRDIVEDSGGADRILLPSGITLAGITIVRNAGGTLTLSWSNGQVSILDALDLTRAVETLVFSNGTTVSLAAQAFETHGTLVNDSIVGNLEELGSRNDVIRGFDGDDFLDGRDGNDLLDGGSGNDAMEGGVGGDSYVVSGHDTIFDNGQTGDGSDRIILPSALRLADLTLTRISGNDLVLAWNGGSVTIDRGLETLRTIELLQFGDGTTASLLALQFTTVGTQAADTLSGNLDALGSRNDVIVGRDGNDDLRGLDGNDRLVGDAGDDVLRGGVGSDVYVVGEGADFIEDAGLSTDAADILELPGTLTLSGLNVVRLGDGDLVLSWAGGSVRIDNAFSATNGVEQFRFGAGPVASLASLTFETLGSGENENLYGNSGLLGSRNDVIRGFDGDDYIEGLDGNDLIDPGAGNDRAYGGTGDDIYVVSDGADLFAEYQNGGGTDTLRFAENFAFGTLSVARNLDDLELRWSGGSVRLDNHFDGGNAAFELIQLGNRAPVSIAGFVALTTSGAPPISTGDAGDNQLFGTNDGNTLSGLGGSDLILGGGGSDTLDGGAGNDVLYGGAAGDTLLGSDGVDRLEGGDGNDMLDGGLGVDTLVGGAGDDVYLLDGSGDLVVEAEGAGTDTVRTAIGLPALAANIENLELLGSANIDGTGNALANRLTGNSGNNRLDGGAGNDLLIGGLGNDVYIVDSSADVVSEALNGGSDSVEASASFVLGDNIESLTLTGSAAINGTGNGLANRIVGNAGNNILDGGANVDTLQGGAGNDSYIVDNVNDRVVETLSLTVGDTNDAGGIDTVFASVSYSIDTASNVRFVERLTLTGTANINATGNALANVLTGNAGNNILDGGLGNDTLAGGAGNDIYLLDAAGDLIQESADGGVDTVRAAFSIAALAANVENVELLGATNLNAVGNAGNNGLIGTIGNNRLEGLAGDDTLNGGLGADTMIGGSGNDTYIIDNGSDRVFETVTSNATDTTDAGGDDHVLTSITINMNSYNGIRFVERATLTGADNLGLTGNALNNVLTGNLGRNTLDGGTGADILRGGRGDDIYIVDNIGDVADETGGDGVDLVRSSVSWTLGAAFENLELTGTASINATGNALANRLTGNAGNNILDGGAGIDTLIGGAGNDTYIVDSSGDRIIETITISQTATNDAGGIDSIFSSVALFMNAYSSISFVENATLTGSAAASIYGNGLANSLTGNDSANTLDGALGNDILSGMGGNDTMLGGDGDDSLDGGLGIDRMTGGSGNDTYYVDNVSDIVVELAGGGADRAFISVSNYVLAVEVETATLLGSDNLALTGSALDNVLNGNSGNNVMRGGNGADTVVGNDGNDSLFGDDGADILRGGNGDDILIGGLGSDQLQGSAGADVFRYLSAAELGLTGATSDRILDFSATQGDKIDLTAIDANTSLAGDQAFTFIGANAFTGVAGQLRVQASGTNQLVYGDVNGDGLADFLIVVTPVGAVPLTGGDFQP